MKVIFAVAAVGKPGKISEPLSPFFPGLSLQLLKLQLRRSLSLLFIELCSNLVGYEENIFLQIYCL